MRHFIIGITLLSLSLHGAAASTSAASVTPWMPVWPTTPTPLNRRSRRCASARRPPVPDRVLSANPLWAVPLTQLTATREPADLFAVAPAATRRGRRRSGDRQAARRSGRRSPRLRKLALVGHHRQR